MNSLKEIEFILTKIVEGVCEKKFSLSINEQDENDSKPSKNILFSTDISFNESSAIKNTFEKDDFCKPEPDFPQNNFSYNSNHSDHVSEKLIFLNENSNFSFDCKKEQICDTEMPTLKNNENTESSVLSCDSFRTEKEKNTASESSATSSEELLSQEIDKAFARYEAMYEKKDKHVKDVSVQTTFNFNTVSESNCRCSQKTFRPEINNPKYFGSILCLASEKELGAEAQNLEELSTSPEVKEEEINYCWKPPAKRIRLGLSKHIKPKSIFNKIF